MLEATSGHYIVVYSTTGLCIEPLLAAARHYIVVYSTTGLCIEPLLDACIY